MDILISSNLERLIYHLSKNDNKYVKYLMAELKSNGKYTVSQEIKNRINNLVIFDFGTATTYEVLEKNIYIGGGILPGIEMSINALFANTAKLPKVKFSTPDSVLGKNTIEQIQAGIFYGYAGQIKHIIKKIKEVVKDPFIIATGGLGKILSAEIEEIDVYSPDLSIKGLHTLYEYNKTHN